jgi:twinkle protein
VTDEASIAASILGDESRFYTTAHDHQLRLLDTFRKGKQPGETTFYKNLDSMLTLRMGFLYCFTGWPGGGKSEFLTQLSVLQASQKKRKIAFYSPESYPEDEFIDSFIHSYIGKTTDNRFPHRCSEKEYIEAAAFKFLVTQGCSIFVVDPFNSIITEGEDRNIAVSLKKNLTMFKRFAAQHRVMIWLVEHPKTPTEVKDFDQVPTNRHLFGGTMWWNKVDVGVTIHRPNRDDLNDRQVLIKTWKVKRQQLNGRPGEGTLYYDIKSNRYYQDNRCSIHPMGGNESDLYAEKEDQPF